MPRKKKDEVEETAAETTEVVETEEAAVEAVAEDAAPVEVAPAGDDDVEAVAAQGIANTRQIDGDAGRRLDRKPTGHCGQGLRQLNAHNFSARLLTARDRLDGVLRPRH